MTTPSPGPPAPQDASIAIIGGGPGGLTAARILQRQGLQVTVYDRDADSDSRDQGGSLDLREDDGQLALTAAGLIGRFHELARPEGQEWRQFDPATGEVFFHEVPAAGEMAKPEIDRTQLRTLLLDSLTPGTVRWNTHVTGIGPAPTSGGQTLQFADGSHTHHDLVIGADGAFSRVRAAVSDAQPAYTGVTFVEAWFNQVSEQHQWLDEFCGDGAAAGADGARGLVVQRSSGDHIRVYLMLKAELDTLTDLGVMSEDLERIRPALLQEFHSWDARLLPAITDNDGPFIARPIWALPIGHRWTHSPSTTLIGDAAHVMPPVGIGVNLAMLDAYELALALTAQPTIDDAIRAYEQPMWARSEDIAAQAHDGFAMLLNGAPPPSMDEA
jgi:2-polyprenyl-6-methoxyphenol hydroxylase-like FAD-dependent oxidoreductase